MVSQEHTTQTEQLQNPDRKYFSLTGKNVLQFLSSLIIPLMFGVFTVVITLHQQNMAREQRIEDMQLAREQRIEDMQLVRQQLNESREQRIEDMQLARQQLSESQAQRKQEWDLAIKDQQVQNQMAIDRYRDEVLVAYTEEIGDLLKENNGSLTSNSITHTLARVKTLNVIRQLDGSRQIHVIRFLCEARQLTNTNESDALDMSTAELTNIDFQKSEGLLNTGKISLAGVYLRNCTFSTITLINVNFSFARLENVDFLFAKFENVNFSYARLENVNFSFAKFENVSFSYANLNDVYFSLAGLENVNFSFAEFENVNFLNADPKNVNFSSANFYDVNFSYADFHGVNFSSASVIRVNLSSATVTRVNFSSAILTDVNFSSATLIDVNFSSAQRLLDVDFASAEFYGVDFSSAKLKNVDFSSAELTDVNFSSSYELENVNFSSATFIDVNFSSAEFSVYWPSNFHHAKMAHTIFVKCNCKWTDFSYANLSMSVFWHANLWGAIFHNADLTKTNFSLANLLEADLTNTTVTGSQLQGALSIYNAKLPNGTLGRSQNLVKNGDANCNISLADHWQVRNGNIAVVASKENRSECQFSLQSVAIEAIMSQRIDLVGIWDSSIWTHSSVEFQAHMSSGVSIELSGRSSSGTIIDKIIINSAENELVIALTEDMQELEVMVTFNADNNKSNNENNWCDNIELFIDYDMG